MRIKKVSWASPMKGLKEERETEKGILAFEPVFLSF